MAFSFSTVPLKPEAKTLDMFEMANITNDLMTTVESLGAAERNFAEVQGVVENVNQSLNLIAKFGQNAIHQLNLDGGLEELVGVKEQLIFPEIEYDKIEKLRGMNIAITTTAKTDEEARELLRLLGAPFSSGNED